MADGNLYALNRHLHETDMPDDLEECYCGATIPHGWLCCPDCDDHPEADDYDENDGG